MSRDMRLVHYPTHVHSISNHSVGLSPSRWSLYADDTSVIIILHWLQWRQIPCHISFSQLKSYCMLTWYLFTTTAAAAVAVARQQLLGNSRSLCISQATVKLGEIESQLQRGQTTADRYSYLASAVVDACTPAIHSGQSLIAKIGGSSVPAAQGVQSTVGYYHSSLLSIIHIHNL